MGFLSINTDHFTTAFAVLFNEKINHKWMWSGASVAHTTPVQEDLGSILHTTILRRYFWKLSSPFFQTTDLKMIHKLVNCDGDWWDVWLFLVRLMFCSTLIMFDNKKLRRFSLFQFICHKICFSHKRDLLPVEHTQSWIVKQNIVEHPTSIHCDVLFK
jgi:hypothetical protein